MYRVLLRLNCFLSCAMFNYFQQKFFLPQRKRFSSMSGGIIYAEIRLKSSVCVCVCLWLYQIGKFAYLTDKVLIDKRRKSWKSRERERDNNAATLFEIKMTKLKWKFATSLARASFTFSTHTEEFSHCVCVRVCVRADYMPDNNTAHTMHTQRKV